ncbi:MAG TPA: hypothetical protein VIM67_09825 [Terriglobus sp.]
MNESMDRFNSEMSKSLKTYLHDHIAGAQHAIQLFEALKELNDESTLSQFAAEQLQQIKEDLEVLENIAKRLRADEFQIKEIAGWIGDKLSRLKLAPLGKPFHTFEALEFLTLGILGKRALWRTLRLMAPRHPELTSVDFDQLIERAEAQYEATETMRLGMAQRVFVI